MSLIFTSEYVGTDNKRVAQVFKNANTLSFTVQCYDIQQLVQQEIFNTETKADNFAEDWVLKDSASE